MPDPMRAVVRTAIRAWRRVRFRAWVMRLRLELRRHGARLVLDAPHRAEFERPPVIKVFPDGDGQAVTTLRLGRDVRLGRDLTIEIHGRGRNELAIGDSARLTRGVWIQLRSGSLRIGADATVRDGAWLKTDGALEIGDGALIGPGSSIHCSGSIALGDLIGIAENVSILDSDHSPDGSDTHWRDQPLRIDPITIGRNVLISAGVVILRGAQIGDNVVIGANAVVRAGSYGPASVLTGNPATVAKTLRDA